MVDAYRQPGFDTPGPTTPGPTTPGSAVADTSAEGVETVMAEGVAIDATGRTVIGSADGRGGAVREVRVDADAADFDFNIERDGNDVFTAEQSPGGTTEESFEPDDDDNARFDGEDPEAAIDVSSPSATVGATATVWVVVALEEA